MYVQNLMCTLTNGIHLRKKKKKKSANVFIFGDSHSVCIDKWKANAESGCLLSCRYMRTGGRTSRITSLQAGRTAWWPLPMRTASGTTCPATTTCPTSARKAQVLCDAAGLNVRPKVRTDSKLLSLLDFLSKSKLNQLTRRDTIWLLVYYG